MNIVRLVFQGTNGMASGNTLEEALLHGICEAFERHCKTLVEFDKYYETKIIDQDTITSKPIRDLLFKLKMFGVKVDLRDCSLGLGIPVVASIRQVDQNDYTICYGCSPNPEEATMRAILESVQTASVPDLYINKDIVIERHFSGQVNIISFKDIPNLSNNNIKVEIEQINSILEKNDMKVYFMNCTIPGIDVPAVYVYIKNTRFNRRMFYRNYVHGDHFIVRDYVNAIKGNKLEY